MKTLYPFGGLFLSVILAVTLMSCDKDYSGDISENIPPLARISPPTPIDNPFGTADFYKLTFRFAGFDGDGDVVGYFVRVISVNPDFPDLNNPPADPAVPPTEVGRWIWTEDAQFDVTLDAIRMHKFQVISVDNRASWLGYEEVVRRANKASRDLMYSGVDQEIFLSGQEYSSQRGYGVYDEQDEPVAYYAFTLDHTDPYLARPVRIDLDSPEATAGVTPGVDTDIDDPTTPDLLEGANLSQALITTGDFVDLGNEENLILAPWDVSNAVSEIYSWPAGPANPANIDPADYDRYYYRVTSLTPQVEITFGAAENVLVPANHISSNQPSVGQENWNGIGPFRISYTDPIPEAFGGGEEGYITHYSWSIDDTTTWSEWIPVDSETETEFYLRFFDDEGNPIPVTEDVYDLTGAVVANPLTWYDALQEGEAFSPGMHTLYVRVMDDSYQIGQYQIEGDANNPIYIPATWEYNVIHATFEKEVLLITDDPNRLNKPNAGLIPWEMEDFYLDVLTETGHFNAEDTENYTIVPYNQEGLIEMIGQYAVVVSYFEGVRPNNHTPFINIQDELSAYILSGGKVWLSGNKLLQKSGYDDKVFVRGDFPYLFGVNRRSTIPQGASETSNLSIIGMNSCNGVDAEWLDAPENRPYPYREDFYPAENAEVIFEYRPYSDAQPNVAGTIFKPVLNVPQTILTNFPLSNMAEANPGDDPDEEYNRAKEQARPVVQCVMDKLRSN
ncbi:MAG: hypothetical protein D6675_14170 [Gemmatimonadetes bacterium]|nr:MAG: hypothetical protein D6675_14170 [Gemmatimonadota bacterium]